MRDSTVNLIEEIRNYLIEHPNAGDNREGIFHFWLSGKARQKGWVGIDRALAILVEAGWLTAKPIPNGDIIYMSTAKVKQFASPNAKDQKS